MHNSKEGLNFDKTVNLIGSTKTEKGLLVQAELDNNVYQKGIKISDEEFEKINIFPKKFHGEWNYVIKPAEIN